jgi:hypothetical protein
MVNHGHVISDRQLRPGVVDLTGADIEQRMGMRYRDFGLLLNIPFRTSAPQEQHGFVLLKPNPGDAFPLLGEEAFDLAHSSPFPLDEAGQGRGEEEAAANDHQVLRSVAMKTASASVQPI